MLLDIHWVATWRAFGERGVGFTQQKGRKKNKEEIKTRNGLAYRKMRCLFRLQSHSKQVILCECILYIQNGPKEHDVSQHNTNFG